HAILGAGQPNVTLLSNPCSYDCRAIYVAKYDAAGTLQWAEAGTDEGVNAPLAAAVDPRDGAPIIAGYFVYPMTFDLGEPGERTLVPVGFYDMFVAKFSPTAFTSVPVDPAALWLLTIAAGASLGMYERRRRRRADGRIGGLRLSGCGPAVQSSEVEISSEELTVGGRWPNLHR
ncbi:MAG: hypothetical protein HYV63_19750, partial [Candidatus Schekmanbacteria bacterium]|nr:hypothetical protein [Candidatus Schekmanbacteria bacterium]